VVNAFGDVRDPATGKLIAGARRSESAMQLADTALEMKHGRRGGFHKENTTLVVVATNARLEKAQAIKLAQLAQNGVAHAVSPAHTMFDGDLVVALSLGAAEADVNALGVAAAEAAAEAIVRAVRLAPTLGGVPGLAG